VVLLVIVVVSLLADHFCYPSGGGSYIVSKDNLGPLQGWWLPAALLIDYVLTVFRVYRCRGAEPEGCPSVQKLGVQEHLVLYCVLAVALLTFGQPARTQESGTLFAIPTYVFVTMFM